MPSWLEYGPNSLGQCRTKSARNSRLTPQFLQEKIKFVDRGVLGDRLLASIDAFGGQSLPLRKKKNDANWIHGGSEVPVLMEKIAKLRLCLSLVETGCICYLSIHQADVAQLVEQRIRNA